ncbi:hypothetical protein SAMN02910377_00193 [Pseudobutyrivibrio ruminis]|uniref:DUF7226 domain-containing protein n=1 Tax=Pseudobutyrivibrio ruminis TaxID=46206 RepID=A0A1H7EXX5_9FIRM|nr:hypothetical protein [Pseudobutyrivibrio ruminis]SEK18679.1 hypothetical protein SAMN02910377_00193 [Pseudobutyrivibrio ruminis]
MKKIPFPQANNLERIYSIFLSIDARGVSKFDIIKSQGLAEREGAYYLDALYFLGYLEKYNTKYFLSKAGVQLQHHCFGDGKAVFAKEILKHHFFYDVYRQRDTFSEDKDFRAYIVHKISNDYQIGLNTAKRRASSVVAWLQWIDNNMKDE